MEIFNKITDILSELSGIDGICSEQDIQSDLGLDSLHMVMLLMMLEEKFGITLNESDMNPFDLNKVSHVVDLVKKYLYDKNDEEK